MTVTAADVETGLPQINLFERLEVLRNTAGFLPVSLRETSEAMSLLSFPPNLGGAASHLNEIFWHQQQAQTEDPGKAVKSVTRQYVGYYTGSRLALTHLRVLALQIGDAPNPAPSLSEEFGMTAYGLRELIRFMDLSTLTEQRGLNELLFDPLRTDYSEGATNVPEGFEDYLKQRASAITVGEARELVQTAMADQQSRIAFWGERLRESQAHALAEPIARLALGAVS